LALEKNIFLEIMFPFLLVLDQQKMLWKSCTSADMKLSLWN